MEAPDQRLNPNIAYIAKVLGVESFMLAENGALLSSEPTAESNADLQPQSQLEGTQASSIFIQGPTPADLVFVSYDRVNLGESFAREQNELLDRMITAMKRDPSDVLRISFLKGDELAALQAIANAHPRAVVALGVEAASELTGETAREGIWSTATIGLDVLATRSLSEILSDPGLKRSVWTHLQTAMRKLT